MIKGVKVKGLLRRPDDRGYFMEIVRSDEGLVKKFGQASFSLAYPGVIKAFHYHKKQEDIWFFASGNAQVVLYDLRPGSLTRGEKGVFYMGEDNPILLVIPAGVAHGYRVLGQRPAAIFYITTYAYNREQPDEYRIPWDDPGIDFDWQTRHR